jgi:opacity protein-like surface antigen
MIPISILARFISLAAASFVNDPVMPPATTANETPPPTAAPLFEEASSASAQSADQAGTDGWHLAIGAGFTTSEDSSGPDEDVEFDEGLMLSLGFLNRTGTQDDDRWAFDWGVQSVWTDQDANSDNSGPVRDTNVLGLYLQGIADYSFSQAFSIYAGAGIGVAWVDVGTTSDQISDFDEEDGPFLSWNAQAGLRWWSSPNVAWNLGYRFLNVDNVELDDGGVNDADFDLETSQHIAEVGVLFHL